MIDPSAILAGKILIVDDQHANVCLLETMLRRAGYLNVSSTMDPTAVCELHRTNNYDLILLDLDMPAIDGFQVMHALRKIESIASRRQGLHQQTLRHGGSFDPHRQPARSAVVAWRDEDARQGSGRKGARTHG